MYKRIATSLVVISALATFSTANAGTIGPKLSQALANSGPDDRIDIIIEFSDKVNVKRLKRKGKKHRREIIRDLKNKSDLTQKQVRNLLRRNGVNKSRSLWLVNSLATSVPAKMVSKIASRPAVKSVKLDAKVTLDALTPGNPVVPEWNLDAVNVTALWSQGITGQGAVVGSMDSGVDVAHQDLSTSWRGGTNSWFDPYGEHASPYDALGHGTQTTSIMVGGNAGGTVIGMAPDAQWIAAKIFNDAGSATYSAIHAGFQWMLDPDGNPTTDDSPDVVNNSWNLDTTLNICDSEFQADIDALRAAGIAVVFSSGNSGPTAATSLSPANNNGVLAVGAVDFSLTVDFYSSRGPSACDGGTYPQIAAPGSDIMVADLTFGGIIPDSYAYATGTSFASAHVAGAFALLASGSPASTLAEIETALQQSAVDAGPVGDDNDYGWGILDVGAAYALLAGATPTSTLQFSVASYSVAENGASATITVSRVGDATGAVTVDYSTVDGSAVAGVDYSAASGSLSFADGVISQTFSVTILDDAVYEGDENFTLNLSNVAGATLGSPSSASVTIIENDPQPPTGSLQLGGASYSVAENGASVSLTVERVGGSFGIVTVDYSTIDGTATAGSDYTAVAGGLVSFADGDAVSKTITIPILDDTVIEGDETFSVNLSNATGGATIGATGSTVVTILENDIAQPGALQFSAAGYSVNENGLNAVLTVTRTGGSNGAVSVSYNTSNGTASAGSDYTSVVSGLISFANGDAVSKTISIPVLDDTVFEGDETFGVTLSVPTGGATIGAQNNATVTIIENDLPQPGILQFELTAYSISENGLNATVVVTRTGGSDGAVSASYNTANGTATAGSDYTAILAGSVNFADGDTVSKTITIPILDDTVFEGDETFSLALSAPTGGATVGAQGGATVTITENDPPQPGVLQFGLTGYSINENGLNASLIVTRTGGGDGVVTVDYSTFDGTAAGGSDYTISSGVVTFADGDTVSKIITIPVLDDTLVEGNENFSVNLSNATGGATIGATGSATVTIVDNDVAQPGSLQFSLAGYSVNENGVSATLTVTRTGGSDGVVSVDYSTLDGTAAGGSDYTASSGVVAFADGDVISKTITIPVFDDTVVEGDESFTVNLGNASGGATIGVSGNATVTIVDNDIPPPANPDADGDGFTQGLDCNDADSTIYPGAPEIKWDGIDQDCNGYDLTIDIIKAVYKAERRRLVVKAETNLGANANLSVEGFGAMEWIGDEEIWELNVRGLQNSPVSVTVVGVEGSESVVVKID